MIADIPFADLGAMTREVRAELDGAWSDLLSTSRFIGGPVVERFEEEWAAACGTTRALGVANGTDAIQLVLTALGIGAGDEVVVPTNTFVATAEAVVLAGATPRFADVDPDTLLLTPETLEAAIGPRTRAVIVVHLYGQPADMDALGRAARRAGVLLIEDAAQAHGATWNGRPAGSMGVAGTFSFYPGKNLGAFGDAGAVVTSDEGLADRVASLRDHGRLGGSHYEHGLIGTNSRLDALQAAVLLAKLKRLDDWNQARRAIVARYQTSFRGTGVRLVRQAPQACGVHHLAVVRMAGRDQAREALQQRGIATQVHYPEPCHAQAPYRQFADGPLPNAEAAAGEILSLPLFPHMTDQQVRRVCQVVHEVAEQSEQPDVA